MVTSSVGGQRNAFPQCFVVGGGCGSSAAARRMWFENTLFQHRELLCKEVTEAKCCGCAAEGIYDKLFVGKVCLLNLS